MKNTRKKCKNDERILLAMFKDQAVWFDNNIDAIKKLGFNRQELIRAGLDLAIEKIEKEFKGEK